MSEALLNESAQVQSPAIDTLWYTRCPVPTTSGIAQHKRWLQNAFAARGITLDSIRASQDRAVRESHFRHSLPGSFREGGNVPAIWARANGQDTVVVAITWVDEEQLVLVRGDDTLQTSADLQGRRLGLLRTAGGDLVDVGRAEALRGLLTALQLGDVPRQSVQFVDIEAPEWELNDVTAGTQDHYALSTQALLEGKVDAIFIKGASVAKALALGLRPIVNLNEQADPLLRLSAGSPRPVTVDRETLERAPERVAEYLAVLLKTAQWAARHPEEVVTVISAETGVAAEDVRRAFGPKLHFSFEPSLSPIYVEGLLRQKAFLLREGFIKDDFDLDHWIDSRPLKQAALIEDQVELIL